ncbi:MAG TPA: 6-phosphogluconolactonase [Bradyrhizobium sp.]
MADSERQIITAADTAELAMTAAARIIARIDANAGLIAICLSGGSSPKQLYRLLATDPYRNRIPWDRVHWFIGDERFVPETSDLSNMGVARRIFLDQCAPASNIHPVSTDAANPDSSAEQYARDLKSFYGADELKLGRPLFDLVLMGAGSDGHTASLFPGDPALDETARWVVGVPKAHLEPFVPRVTLTLPALGSCHEMLFEVAGSGKRAILTRLLDGENLPANRARSADGNTVWLVDRAALPEGFRSS